VLLDEGFRVIPVADGKQALAAFRCEPEIGLIVSDNEMPALTGLELLREVRRRSPGIPFLLMSGKNLGWDEASRDLAYCFLRKPFSRSELLRAIHSLLDDGRAE
jgi:DNA-binding NtrC family response regulator